MEKFGKETYVHDNYSYYEDKSKKKKKPSKKTYQCSCRKDTHCPAIIEIENGVLTRKYSHRDLPRKNFLRKKRLEEQMVKKAVNSIENINAIFKDAEKE